MKKILTAVDTAYYLLSQMEFESTVTVRREFSYEPISKPLSHPYITVGLGKATHTVDPNAPNPVTGAHTKVFVTVRVYIPQQNGARSAQSLLDQIAETLLSMLGTVSFSMNAPEQDMDTGAVVHHAVLELDFNNQSE